MAHTFSGTFGHALFVAFRLRRLRLPLAQILPLLVQKEVDFDSTSQRDQSPSERSRAISIPWLQTPPYRFELPASFSD